MTNSPTDGETQEPMLVAALYYAKRGTPVFPCNPLDKRPLVSTGFKAATTDLDQICAWWAEWPNATVAMPTGPRSGVFVIDLDIPKEPGGPDGRQAWKKLLEAHGPVVTSTNETPSGGLHIIFRWNRDHPVGNRTGQLPPGIDVRGDGGYIVLPPSRNANGRTYRVVDENAPLSEAPAWLFEMLKPKPRAKLENVPAEPWPPGHEHYAAKALKSEIAKMASAGSGTRNTALNRAAFVLGTLVPVGALDEDEARARLREAALACGLGEDEIEATLESGISKGMKSPRPVPPSVAERSFGNIEPSTALPGTPGASPEADAWPEPLDLFGTSLDLGLPSLPANALPGVIEEFARDEGERLGVEPGAIALACLVVAASCIHDGFTIQPKRNDTSYVESARLWGMLAGDPGTKKTPIMKAAVAPLGALATRWFNAGKGAAAAYQLAKKIYDAKEKKYAAKPEGEPPLPPEKPPVRRALINDATVEALSEILPDSPGGLLGVFDELAALFGSFDTYKAKGGRDRQDWLELYNGGQHVIDRISRGTVHVPNWGVSLLGGIQPDKLRKLAPHLSDDGLVQRFLPVNCQRNGPGMDREPNQTAAKGYHDLIFDLADLTPFDSTPIRLTEGAQHYREDVTRLLENLSALPEISPAFAGFAQKFDGFFARILLAFHVIETTAIFGEPIGKVEAATAERAHRFFTRYLIPHAAHVHRTMIGQGEAMQHAAWIAGHILTHRSATLTASEVGRAYNALRGFNDEINKAMALLSVMGWCRRADQVRRDSFKWEINPAIHIVFAARASEERTRRASERERIASAKDVLGEFRGRS